MVLFCAFVACNVFLCEHYHLDFILVCWKKKKSLSQLTLESMNLLSAPLMNNYLENSKKLKKCFENLKSKMIIKLRL